MSVRATFETFEDGRENITKINKTYIFQYPCKSLLYCKPYKVILSPGRYIIELWGAQGDDALDGNGPSDFLPNKGGRGSYTRGILSVDARMSFYIYLGAKGEDQTSVTQGVVSHGGWNFGGNGGIDPVDVDSPPESSAGGGGGVDIRLLPVDTQTTNKSFLHDSILSRIMVAGSGGGAASELVSSTNKAGHTYGPGTPGGALANVTYYVNTIEGNQTHGELGKGQDGYSIVILKLVVLLVGLALDTEVATT